MSGCAWSSSRSSRSRAVGVSTSRSKAQIEGRICPISGIAFEAPTTTWRCNVTAAVENERRPRTSTSGWGSGTSATGASHSASPGPTSGTSSRRRSQRDRFPAGSGTRTCSAPSTAAASSACRSGSTTRTPGCGRSTGRTADAPGLLDPPVIGSFTGDIGVFEGDGHVRRPLDPRALHLVGRSRRRRRAGSRRSRTTAAETWETNWIMDFTRVLEADHERTRAHRDVVADYRHVEKIAHARAEPRARRQRS